MGCGKDSTALSLLLQSWSGAPCIFHFWKFVVFSCSKEQLGSPLWLKYRISSLKLAWICIWVLGTDPRNHSVIDFKSFVVYCFSGVLAVKTFHSRKQEFLVGKWPILFYVWGFLGGWWSAWAIYHKICKWDCRISYFYHLWCRICTALSQCYYTVLCGGNDLTKVTWPAGGKYQECGPPEPQ